MLRSALILPLLVLLVGCAREPAAHLDDSGNLIPRPMTVEQLTQRAKLIVIGTVVDVQRQTSEGPIGASLAAGSTAPPLPGLASTYYTVAADSIVAGTGVQSGEKFTLRVNGSAKEKTQSGGEMMMPQPGDTRLLVLESDPAIPNAYFPAPWGIFDVGGATARFDDTRGTSVQELAGTNGRSAFLDALRTAVDARP